MIDQEKQIEEMKSGKEEEKFEGNRTEKVGCQRLAGESPEHHRNIIGEYALITYRNVSTLYNDLNKWTEQEKRRKGPQDERAVRGRRRFHVPSRPVCNFRLVELGGTSRKDDMLSESVLVLRFTSPLFSNTLRLKFWNWRETQLGITRRTELFQGMFCWRLGMMKNSENYLVE